METLSIKDSLIPDIYKLDIQKLTELVSLEFTKNGRQIIFVDASSLKDTGCWRKFYWSCIKGYRESEECITYDIRMEYGTSFHKFLEHWYLNKPYEVCLEFAQTYYDKILTHCSSQLESEYEFRTMNHLLQSIKRYTETYPREFDGLKATATEQKFCFPWWQNDKYVIMLCGTIDLVGTYHDIPIICDHKTTASYVTKTYFDQYELGIQTMFYSWVWNYLNKEGDKYRAALINGIFVKKGTQAAQKKGEFDGVKLERSRPFEYTTEQMKEFFEPWLEHKLEKIKTLLNNLNKFITYDLTFCKTPYGLCKFFNVCASPPSSQELVLKNRFRESTYNPLSFGGSSD